MKCFNSSSSFAIAIPGTMTYLTLTALKVFVPRFCPFYDEGGSFPHQSLKSKVLIFSLNQGDMPLVREF
jgi:hypothetical protein